MSNSDLEQFYDLLAQLNTAPNQGLPLRQLPAPAKLPQRGVYYFVEPGEFRTGKTKYFRVVRVGTHSLRNGSKAKLHGRLKNHYGTKSGGGNHRCSIFRLHIGSALLARDRLTLATWGKGSSASKQICDLEIDCERAVSEHIGNMRVFWIEVPDDPSPESDRGLIERNSIALLSNHFKPIDRPSKTWLGSYSPHTEIRASGLWNVKHVDEDYAPSYLKRLQHFVERTCARVIN